MIDYRPIIVQYIKDTITVDQVYNAALTFKENQDKVNYATYYILSEQKASFVNNVGRTVNSGNNTLLDDSHSPLTIVTMSLDIRGSDSFNNMRDLRNSFGTISNKEILSNQGVSFMGIGDVTSLPQVKNTKNEEGYIFDLVFSFDNSYIAEVTIADVVTINGLIKLEG